jgi:hypothetical protein
MQPLGPVSAEPEADVSGVLRSAEKRDGLGEQLRLSSLAHPAWPYAGTAWEWRAFVGKVEARFQYLNFGPELS